MNNGKHKTKAERREKKKKKKMKVSGSQVRDLKKIIADKSSDKCSNA